MKDVNCAVVRDAFRAGRLPVDAAVLAHVRECPRCTELFADDARLGRALGSTHPAPLAGPDLLRGLRLRLEAESGPRAWLRSRSTTTRVAMLAGLGGLAIVISQRGEQAGLGARHGFEPTAWIVGFAALLLSGVLSFLRPLGRPRSSLTARSLLLFGAITAPVLYALAAPVHSSSDAGALLPKSLACLGLGIALAVPFIALLWLVDRADRMTAWRVALLSATGGLLSNLGLALHCAVDEPLHLLLGHAPLALALALALFVLRAVRSFRTTAN